jgi:signal transduction histidine kinase
LVVGLAAAAGVAIENARLHARVAELALFEDRERIARDLHDTVIQRLFATGLSLQGTAPLVERDPDKAAARIDAAVDDLDETVKHIRTAIFALESSHPQHEGLRARILALCREASGALGFDPHVVFDGPIDSRIPDAAAVDLLATLREGLSNVARHAGAQRVDVAVTVGEGSAQLVITDDGTGIPEDSSGGHGLPNMTTRASRHGGTLLLSAGPTGGTVLRWEVPLS